MPATNPMRAGELHPYDGYTFVVDDDLAPGEAKREGRTMKVTRATFEALKAALEVTKPKT